MPFDRNAIATELQQRTTVTQLVALLAVNEFFDHFVYLKKSLNDFQATKLTPSPLVDAVWRIVLVDTIKYSAMCGLNFIHHESDDNSQSSVEVREKRYAATRAQIRLRFGQLDEKIWPPNYLVKRVVFSDPLVIGKTGAGSKRHIGASAPSGIAKKNSSGAYTGTHKIKVRAKEESEEEEDEDYEIDVVEEVDDEDELDATTEEEEEEQEEEGEEEEQQGGEEIGEEAVGESDDFVKQLRKEFDAIEKHALPELKRSASQHSLQSLVQEIRSQGSDVGDRAGEPNHSNIGVFVSAKNAPKFKVSIYSESDVHNLKRVVMNQLHIDAIRHQLVFQGKPLVENSKTLLEHGLNDNSTVYVREIETK